MDKKLPLVTIITNTKNRARLISRCIESIQNQTYQNYEHIVADGGTDNTKKIVESYNDPHIIYISEIHMFQIQALKLRILQSDRKM
jgi:glycosyltransferase involved in cell wall biosynthesis